MKTKQTAPQNIDEYIAGFPNTEFKEELSIYESGKGTAKFPLDTPIPYDLISKIVKFRAKENYVALMIELEQLAVCMQRTVVVPSQSQVHYPASLLNCSPAPKKSWWQ